MACLTILQNFIFISLAIVLPVNSFSAVLASSSLGTKNSRDFDEEAANLYVNGYYEEEASRYCNLEAIANFEYQTDVENATAQENAKAARIALAEFQLNEFNANISQFNYQNFENEDLKRQFKFLRAIIGASALNPDDLSKYDAVLSEMSKIHGLAKVCPYSKQNCDLATEGHSLEPVLTEILGKMENFNEMAYYWRAWRDASGKKMRSLYHDYIDLSNKAAEVNGYANMGEFWLLSYESNTATLRQELDAVWGKVRTELYIPLYDFVRHRLSKKFLQMDPTAPMPAHVFGNMRAKSWGNVLPWVLPHPDATAPDITKALQESVIGYPSGLDERRSLFTYGNSFFRSLGLAEVQVAYGEKAMIMKPAEREVICGASAWDMCDGADFRIKMCTEINHEDFLTIHRQLGQIQYYMQYKNQPITYRTGANPGFLEAIGDVVGLSVSSRKHLNQIGFLPEEVTDESVLNYLMQMALEKVAFLPFGYLIDSYRWDVFSGKIPRDNLTYNWIKMRANIQGITPPFKRTEEDFDAGAESHVPGNSPYIHQFVNHILQFQIHQKLCLAAGQGTHLHECTISGSRAAGELFKSILESGASNSWKQLLMDMTGEDKLNPDGIIAYFKPLKDYLKTAAEIEGYPSGWEGVDIDQFFGDGEFVTPTQPPTTTTTITTTELPNTEGETDPTSIDVTGGATWGVTEEVTGGVTEEVTGGVTEEVTEGVTEEVTGGVTSGVTGGNSAEPELTTPSHATSLSKLDAKYAIILATILNVIYYTFNC